MDNVEPRADGRNGRSASMMERARLLWAHVAVAAAFVAFSAAYLWLFVLRFSVNVVFWDDWSQVPLFARLTLGRLWAQHNENRMLVPNLITYVLGRADHFNARTEMVVSALILMAAVAVLMRAGRRFTGSPYLLIPVPVIMFGLVQWQDALWAFQLAWYLILLLVITALAALGRNSRASYGIALACAVVASFSSLQGLIVWPAGGFLFAWSEGGSRRARWRSWAATGLMCMIVYLYRFHWSNTGGPSPLVSLGRLGADAHFLLILLGTIVYETGTKPGYAGASILGGLVLLVCAYTLADWVRGRRQGLNFPVALIIFGLLFDGTVVIGRVGFGPTQALASRYTLYNLLVLGALYLYWLGVRRTTGVRPMVRAMTAALVFLIAMEWASAVAIALPVAGIEHHHNEWAADILVNVPHAPNRLIQKTLWPDPAYVRREYPLLVRERLSTFASPDRARFARLGVVPFGYFSLPLVVPPAARKALTGHPAALMAWKVLWAVYEQTPAERRRLPPSSPAFVQKLAAWGVRKGTHPNRDQIYLRRYRHEYARLALTAARGASRP